MSLPIHKNPVDRNGNLNQERIASAPYNFVPLPEIVVKDVDDADQLPDHSTFANVNYSHTGYFDVTLTTKSPLYVRCPFNINDFIHQERGEDADLPYDQQVKNTSSFFYTRNQDKPVIPGSSIRGLLRNLMEVVSYGKVQGVTDRKLFYRTVGSDSVGRDYMGRMSTGIGRNGDGYRQNVKAGFARKRGADWIIEECDVARVEMIKVANAFSIPGTTLQSAKAGLYTSLNPDGGPNWAYQHKAVWVLTEPAIRDHLHSQGKYLRYLKITGIRNAPSGVPGEREGILVLTGPMQRQHMAFVFLHKLSPAIINIPNDSYEEDMNLRILDRFHDDDQITRWQAMAFPNGQPAGATRERNGALRNGEPVFYLLERGQLSFFGRAQMFRLPYKYSPLDLVPAELRRPEDIDYADAMFGFVRTRRELDEMKVRGLSEPPQGSKARAYSSRIFVTDANLNEGQNDIWLFGNPVITPRILATPKATTFQHYLVQTADDRNTLKHYGNRTPQETIIRGHKRYWHQALGDGLSINEIRAAIEENRDRLQEIEQSEVRGRHDTQHTRIRPVKPEVKFTFRVYFMNLSARELGAICWVLHPLGDENKTYCHHLGMGKPLGMGGVLLDAKLHLTNRQARYASLFDGDSWQKGGIGTGKDLSNRNTTIELTHDFEQHILGELATDRVCTHLSDLERIGMLLKTMEWPGYRADQNGDLYLRESNRPNTRYMLIKNQARQNEYRERPVLPDPRAFGELTGYSKSTIHAGVTSRPLSAPGNQGAINSRPPQQSQSSGLNSAATELESVKKSIRSLSGPGEVSRLDEIVKRIEVIQNVNDRFDCAKMLQKWLQNKKLWENEKHTSKDWYKKLTELLGQGG